MPGQRDQRDGTHCAECGDWYPDDGETAGVMGGQFLCAECCGVSVVFVGECITCDWSYRKAGRRSNRYSVKQVVQQEKNNHETEKKHFEGERHETVWRRVEPTAAEKENPVMPDAE
jgi:hypothetical protein